MDVNVIQVGPLMVNCYIVHDSENCLIIDPGDEPDKIINYIKNSGFKPLGIFNTHGHFDHIGAVKRLKEEFGIKFYIHESDVFLVKESASHGAFFGVMGVESPEIDEYVKDGDVFDFDGLSFKVIHTPGHSPGGVCYYFEREKTVFSGDTLFELSVGRTDFPYGDMDMLINSIKNKLFSLGDDITVYPGHGEKTNIRKERENNMFLK